MKRIAAIAIAVFLFLFSVSAFADTSNNSNLIPVQDSNIQSSGWSNYIPAQGNGISGAAILQDSSTNQSLTRQWVHEGGYMQVTKQVAVPKTVWVQSQEWVPPVTHQEWVPPVTHQKCIGWSYKFMDWGSPWYGREINMYSQSATPNELLIRDDNSPFDLFSRIYDIVVYQYGYPFLAVAINKIIIAWRTDRALCFTTYTVNPDRAIDINLYGTPIWETVVDQPGYWKTVVDQPGYWKDTSHWETTVTYQTVQDIQYTESPHWTDYKEIIPQYQLKD
ncbi:hypothetical protein SAMN04324257_00194 [Thermoanaerobacter thermohydrosulfuricus]|nr:hypothetical protein SAMN04324257_00194 [Thermoanaerobacter thermohydrosulfuricus]